MTTTELDALVNNNPTVKQAAAGVAAAKSKLDGAAAARDAAYNYWQEKKGDYERSGKLTPPGLKEQRRLLMVSAEQDYNSKNGAYSTANSEYQATLGVYDKVRKQVNDTIVAQANAASAAEIENAKAAAAKSQTATSANVTKTVQAATGLEAEKAKRQKFILIGGIVFIIIVIFGIYLYKKYKK